jgi:lipoyl(octanoyl) transferase
VTCCPDRDRDAAPTRGRCIVESLGRVAYEDALALQEDLVRKRTAGECPDRLLLLEHPHVLTLGRSGKRENVLVDAAHLQAMGVDLFDAGRGGDVTYHGPGQLVAYPILDLAPDRCDLHRYVRDLERVLIATLLDFRVRGHAIPGRTGVWVERPGLREAKVAAIGVRVARWISSHGIALNANTDLSYFQLIVPCGLQESAVTSLAELVGHPVDMIEVATRFTAHFGAVFDRDMVVQSRPTGSRREEANA